jgi:hypothetical protein
MNKDKYETTKKKKKKNCKLWGFTRNKVSSDVIKI